MPGYGAGQGANRLGRFRRTAAMRSPLLALAAGALIPFLAVPVARTEPAAESVVGGPGGDSFDGGSGTDTCDPTGGEVAVDCEL